MPSGDRRSREARPGGALRLVVVTGHRGRGGVLGAGHVDVERCTRRRDVGVASHGEERDDERASHKRETPRLQHRFHAPDDASRSLVQAFGMQAETFCLSSAGAFFLVGLVCGTWKYAAIFKSAEAKAPYYVDVAHRASLLYAFACALLSMLSARSAWPNVVNLAASIVLVVFFAAAVLGYIVHGWLRDTDNQLKRPHRLGRGTISPIAMLAFMAALIVGEIGGFLVVFSGFIAGRS